LSPQFARLRLSDTVPVSLREEGELANINYVYRVELPDRSLYLKVVRNAQAFPSPLPEERLFSEAEALRRFRRLASREIVILRSSSSTSRRWLSG